MRGKATSGVGREQVLLEELSNALHGIEAPFACSGSLVPEAPVTLRFRDATQVAVRKQDSRSFHDASLDALIAHCSVAPFGKGKRTLRDLRVRDALQLKAEGGAFTVLNFDPAEDGVLAQVQKELCPSDPNPITAELYNVNVYQERGHFVPHKDTPRGSEMLGTLVVCLPSRFSDGKLILRHRGANKVFDWGGEIESQKEPTRIHWAAFFGDVDHTITPLWFGRRVTLTYLLHRGKGAVRRPAPATATAERLQKKLEEALDDSKFMPHGGTLGFPCSHMYSHVAAFQKKLRALNDSTVHKLKGCDYEIAAAAMAVGLDVTLKPYLVENCVDETWQLGRFPSAEDRHRLGGSVTRYEIEEVFPVTDHASEDEEMDVRWVIPKPEFNGDVEPLEGESEEDCAAPVVQFFASAEYSATGYFGNEGSEVDFYVYAAVHVEVPAFGTGVRKRTATSRAAALKPRRPARARRAKGG